MSRTKKDLEREIKELKEERENLLMGHIEDYEKKFEDYKEDITSKFSNFVDDILA